MKSPFAGKVLQEPPMGVVIIYVQIKYQYVWVQVRVFRFGPGWGLHFELKISQKGYIVILYVYIM